jgi:hypothetical protein
MPDKIPKFAEEVIDRNPQVFPYGFFASDMYLGFISWFKNIDEMMEFLLKTEPIIWDYEGEELENYSKAISKIAKKVKSIGLNEESRISINELVSNDFEIPWWGTFNNLLKSESEFTKNIREEFLEEVLDTEDKILNNNIPEESIESFIVWLKTFRC